jgi:hypothetical protein
MTRDELHDTDPITLGYASQTLLRGVISKSALYAEYQRGNLVCERIGRNLFTTPQYVREMRERCRVNHPRRDSTSDQMTGPGSSATTARTAELDALRESVRKLKSVSPSTSPRSTSINQQSAANPIPFPSQKC